ncbi:phage terminase large subunit [Methylocystis sp.]|uniref:phage terminase large subunit n=1 Tax=Methylocystis sp. TaxID=1911079 RepID=UPI00345C342B
MEAAFRTKKPGRRRPSRSFTVERIVKDTELGRALAQDLYRTGHLRAIAQPPQREKLARLLAQAARFEAGQDHLPESAPWLATYLNELLGFPNSTHDDQVDATSQASCNLATLRQPSASTRASARPMHGWTPSPPRRSTGR